MALQAVAAKRGRPESQIELAPVWHGTREDCVTPIVESGNKSFDRAFSKSNGEF